MADAQQKCLLSFPPPWSLVVRPDKVINNIPILYNSSPIVLVSLIQPSSLAHLVFGISSPLMCSLQRSILNSSNPTLFVLYLQIKSHRFFLVGIMSMSPTLQKNFPLFWAVRKSIFFLWFFYISPISLTPPSSALTIPFENHRVTPL